MILALALGCAMQLLRAPISSGPMPLESVASDARTYVNIEGERWLLDTAAAATTCDAAWVHATGAQVRPTTITQVGELGAVRVGRTVLARLDLGDWAVSRVPCLVRDLGATSSAVEGTVGVLGADLLRRFAVRIDFEGGELELVRGPRSRADGLRLRLTKERGSARLLVPVAIDGEPPILALVDSGADRTYLPGRAGAVVERWPGVRRGTGGAPVRVEVEVREGVLVLGGALRVEGRWIVRDAVPGLLGVDLLRAVGPEVIINFRHQELTWVSPGARPARSPIRPRSPPSRPPPRRMPRARPRGAPAAAEGPRSTRRSRDRRRRSR